jgi:diguanylate cyclase (GGDEF)-like protein
MSIKAKVIISISVFAFLAALAVLVANLLLISHFIDSDRFYQKNDIISMSVFIWFLVIVLFLAVSIPFSLFIAKKLSAPIDKMLDKASFDSLTGIYNRRYLDENLKNLINILSRANGNLTLLMIEIDFFKDYNDTYGFNMGDNCLKFVASLLTKSVSRTEDFVARYGGKEFVVVLPNTDENGARIISEKILAAIRSCRIPHEKNEAADYVTISIGAATGKADSSQTSSQYIDRAHKMLLKSMQDGYNRYSFA